MKNDSVDIQATGETPNALTEKAPDVESKSDQVLRTAPSEKAGAYISDCGRFRYSLWRRWDTEESWLGFVMLNPSTADAMMDDPTIRKCIGFAKRWGFGGILVANLYPFRATDPRELKAVGYCADRRFTEAREINQRALTVMWSYTQTIVAAWGVHARPQDADLARCLIPRLFRIGALTNNGNPRHPLMAPYALTREPYSEHVPTPNKKEEDKKTMSKNEIAETEGQTEQKEINK